MLRQKAQTSRNVSQRSTASPILASIEQATDFGLTEMFS